MVKLKDIYDDIVYNELVDASCILEQIRSAAVSANYYINSCEYYVCDEEMGVCNTIESLAETLKVAIEVVRNDIALFYRVAVEPMYAYLNICFDIDNDSETDNVDDYIADLLAGKFDKDEIFFSMQGEAYHSIVCATDSKTFTAFRNFLKQHFDDAEIQMITNFKGKNLYLEKSPYNKNYEINQSIGVKESIRKLDNKVDRNIALIRRYMEYGSNITFSYEGQQMHIRPLQIVQYDAFGDSYVVTISNKTLVAYRIEKMNDIIESKKKIEITNQSLLDEKLPYVWNMDMAKEFTFKLKFVPVTRNVLDKARRDLSYYVEGKAGYQITYDNMGNMYVEGKAIGESSFRRWLRGYGAAVVVLEPRWLGEKMIESAKKAWKLYQ